MNLITRARVRVTNVAIVSQIFLIVCGVAHELLDRVDHKPDVEI